MPLNTRPINGGVIDGYETSEYLSYTSTSTPSLVKSVSKYITTSIDYVLVVLTDIALHLVALSKAVTSTVSIGKALTKTIATVASSVVSITKVLSKTLTSLSTSNATIIKSVNKTISYLSTSIVTVFKLVNKFISASSSSTVSVVKSVGKLVITAVEHTASILTETALHVLSLVSTAVSTSSVSKAVTHAITATAVSTASTVKSVGKYISALVTSTVTLLKSKVLILYVLVSSTIPTSVYGNFINGLTVNFSSINSLFSESPFWVNYFTVSLTKQVNKSFNIVSTSISSVFKGVFQSLFILVGAFPPITYGNFVGGSAINLAAINAYIPFTPGWIDFYTPTLTKNVNKNLTSISSTAVSIVKTIGKNFATIIDITLVVLNEIGKHLVSLSYTVTETVSLQKVISKVILAYESSVVVVAKAIHKSIATTVISTVTAFVQLVEKLGAIFKDTLFVPIRKRLTTLTEDRMISLGNVKQRLTSLIKSRTVSKTEDLNG
jgi:hypothetical protein